MFSDSKITICSLKSIILQLFWRACDKSDTVTADKEYIPEDFEIIMI